MSYIARGATAHKRAFQIQRLRNLLLCRSSVWLCSFDCLADGSEERWGLFHFVRAQGVTKHGYLFTACGAGVKEENGGPMSVGSDNKRSPAGAGNLGGQGGPATSRSETSMPGFIQQQSTIFVFSTAMANQGAEYVKMGKHNSLIGFHMECPSTQQNLAMQVSHAQLRPAKRSHTIELYSKVWLASVRHVRQWWYILESGMLIKIRSAECSHTIELWSKIWLASVKHVRQW